MELVGFVLGSDLYQIASGIKNDNEDVIGFFDFVYENKPLAHLLDKLNRGDTENLTELEDAARAGFVDLNQAFSTFLSTNDALRDLERLELYKIVLGCFSNLPEIVGKDYWNKELKQAIQAIENCAAKCIHRLTLLQDRERK